MFLGYALEVTPGYASFMESEETSEESAQESKEDPGSRSRWKRFSPAQQACLKAYYANGMTGAKKKHGPLIEKAAHDTHLTVKQVKVCLRR